MARKRKHEYHSPRIHIVWSKEKNPGDYNQDCPICLAAPEYLRRALEGLTGVPQDAYLYEAKKQPKRRRKPVPKSKARKSKRGPGRPRKRV